MKLKKIFQYMIIAIKGFKNPISIFFFMLGKKEKCTIKTKHFGNFEMKKEDQKELYPLFLLIDSYNSIDAQLTTLIEKKSVFDKSSELIFSQLNTYKIPKKSSISCQYSLVLIFQ